MSRLLLRKDGMTHFGRKSIGRAVISRSCECSSSALTDETLPCSSNLTTTWNLQSPCTLPNQPPVERLQHILTEVVRPPCELLNAAEKSFCSPYAVI